MNDESEAAASDLQQVSQLPKGMGFHQTSTEPILRIQQRQKVEEVDDSDDSESEPDEDRFMEFDSSDDDEDEEDAVGSKNATRNEEMIDAQSQTTKSSAAATQH